jgi:hypothetical protein
MKSLRRLTSPRMVGRLRRFADTTLSLLTFVPLVPCFARPRSLLDSFARQLLGEALGIPDGW